MIYSGLLLQLKAPHLLDFNPQRRLQTRSRSVHSFLKPFPISPLNVLAFLDFNLSCCSLYQLSAAFSFVNELVICSPLETPELIRALSAKKKMNGNAIWRGLKTLTILNFDDETIFKTLLKDRTRLDCPLQKLRIGTNLDLATLEIYDWLCESVKLETFTNIDSWPADDLDPNDMLFLITLMYFFLSWWNKFTLASNPQKVVGMTGAEHENIALDMVRELTLLLLSIIDLSCVGDNFFSL